MADAHGRFKRKRQARSLTTSCPKPDIVGIDR
jgi:hypothetical protein